MSLFSGVANKSSGFVNNSINFGQNSIKSVSNESQRFFDNTTGNMFGRMEDRGGIIGVAGKVGNVYNDVAKTYVKAVTGLAEISAGLLSSAWGKTKTATWDNSQQIASSRATESQQYTTTNRSVEDLKKSMNITNLSEADTFLQQKGNEKNTIDQTIRTKKSSWFGGSNDTNYAHRYWQESNDQLLGRYGYETYAQKASNLSESLQWMQVKNMDKLSNEVLIADVKDSQGQNVERDIASNRMNNYFGEYYVDKTRT